MNPLVKLTVALCLFSAIPAGLLALTYSTTAPIIAEREIEEQAKALDRVFFLQTQNGRLLLDHAEIAEGVTALFAPGEKDHPSFYAVIGKGLGYNPSVPLTLMVGFTGSSRDARTLLEGYVTPDRLPPAGETGHFIVGFSVIISEETPGLGEKIKDRRPPFTWVQLITGNRPEPNPDSATDFQRQFRGRRAETLVLRKSGGDLDSITASTITSNGIIAALRDASARLDGALSPR